MSAAQAIPTPEAAHGRAETSTLGELVSAYMRMLVDQVIGDSDSVGSPGIDNLRWVKPVRPGDTLHGRFVVLESRESRSRPDWGIGTGSRLIRPGSRPKTRPAGRARNRHP